MARSLKKGPFADHHLLAKVEKMNEQEKKQVIKTWSLVVQQSSQHS